MPADGNFRASSADGCVSFKGWGVSGQVEWELSDNVQVNSITAFRKYTSNFSNDNDVSPMADSLGYHPLTFRFFSQELRLNGSIGDQIEYTVGGYYSDQKSVYTSFQALRSSALQFQQSDPVDVGVAGGRLARAATTDEVKDLRREASALKECVADLTLENRLLKKA